MLEIRNHTPFLTHLVPGLDKSGHDYAVVVIKGSFDIRHRCPLEISEQQQPITLADEYFGEAGKSSVKYESDTAILKRATDVIINGHAYTSGNKPTTSVDVSLQVGKLHKTRRIFGNRHWEKPLLAWQSTPPEKFTKIPLVYENAYGGIDTGEAAQIPPSNLAENPIGKGYVGSKSKPTEGLPLPNIENPATLIQNWDDSPATVGFGFIERGWQPRVNLAGTYDQQWQKQRLPLLPLDFDDHYFNGAHPDFISQSTLLSGESFHLKNVSESGELSFQLPDWNLRVSVNIKGKPQSYRPVLDTIVIEPDENRVLLTWRATVPCFKQFLYIDSITVKGKH